MPYSEWEREGRYRWNDLFAANRETAVRTQAAVDTSACATITETKNGKSYRVRVCTADSEGITLHAVNLHAFANLYLQPEMEFFFFFFFPVPVLMWV